MNRRLFAAVFSVLVFGILAVPIAKADVNGEMSFKIKGGPVEIPGHVLMPGKYTVQFENVDDNIVLISGADNRGIGLFVVQPQITPKMPDKPEIKLSEGTQMSPERMVGFYDPNLSEGFDFVYPHSPAAARATVASGAVSR